MISNRRLVKVSKTRQSELNAQFKWLQSVHEKQKNEEVKILSVSIFDHWLSWDDASKLLGNVPTEEQARRDGLLAGFCEKMTANTEVLSFVMRGTKKDRPIFRSFKSEALLSNYCKPNGGKWLKHRDFRVVLPEFGCAFYESWDDTYHFFFTEPGIEKAARDWAIQSGVYLLD